jgi:hypothetical protein
MTQGDLAPEALELIQGRMKSHDRIEKTVQLVDVIEAVSSLAPNPSEEAREILSGSSPAKLQFIVDVVKAYRQEKPKKTVKEFFNERYKERALVLVKPADAIQEALRKPEGKV